MKEQVTKDAKASSDNSHAPVNGSSTYLGDVAVGAPANAAAGGSAHSQAGGDQASDAHVLTTGTVGDSSQIAGNVDPSASSHVVSSGAYFVDVTAISQGNGVESLYVISDDHFNGDQLSGIFDNLATGQPNSGFDSGFGGSSGFAIDTFDTFSTGLPEFLSDAKGGSHGGGGGSGGTHGGGGNGGGGGSTPAAFTVDDGTGVAIHVSYDSSVANAPTGFTSVVQQVADFYASHLGSSTSITINIDVGFGEVGGTKLGHFALGESMTQLQDVSYSDLASAYSGSGLSLGSSVPAGTLYVSYAEAKALNIAITDPQSVDGYVGFGSASGTFDYNNSDGVSGGQYDFYGVVAHEFSEVMGRLLLVGTSINGSPSYMAYDLFHYSSPGTQDFSGNGGYFSIDQGATNLAVFNNPSNGGDAGDWASSGTSGSGGSIYDAFNAFGTPGEAAPISHTDLLALQAVGFDLVQTTV